MLNNNKLRQLRHKMQWTQGHAAAQIGIQQSYLSKLENGQALPSNEILASIAHAYSVSFEELAPDIVNNQFTAIKATPQATIGKLLWHLMIICIFIGTLLISISVFGLYQSNTAYTYEVEPAATQVIAPVYLVTDEYKGEKYRLQLKTEKVTYTLIGERDITPFVNRALSFTGLILSLFGVALLSIGLFRKK